MTSTSTPAPATRSATTALSGTADPLDAYNVLWDSPGKNSLDSMPSGNGDIGLNAWVEAGGDLLFYIGKTDAYDDNSRLLKLGRVRVKLSPNPFAAGAPFRQELKLRQGEIAIQAGESPSSVRLRLWVDANHPVIWLEADGSSAFELEVTLEIWREKERTLDPKELSYSDALTGAGCDLPTIQYPDQVVEDGRDRVAWYHHNRHSVWPITMKLQGLESLMANSADPLLGRVFGGMIEGKGMARAGIRALKSGAPGTNHRVAIHILTTYPSTPEAWLREIEGNAAAIKATGIAKARRAHQIWWNEFWNRSWIRVSDPSAGAAPVSAGVSVFTMSRGYALQRYLMACGGRGKAWSKFNGSIFTLPDHWQKGFDPDYRQWDGCQWFQNVRLTYWPMIASGDFEVLEPFFGTYFAALPLASARTKLYYGHEGAFFPETQSFWGTYANSCYGWQRENVPLGFVQNPYVRYYWQGGLELIVMMLEQYAHTQDAEYLRTSVMPLAREIVRFFDQHWKRDEKGQIRFDPAASLETWQKAVNPLPEIAGLQVVAGLLLALPQAFTTEEERREWQRLLRELPALPMQQVEGKTVLAAAAEILEKRRNVENPELYAIFPYRLYRAGKPDIKMARQSFERREIRQNLCWFQDAIQAAYLGLTEQAGKHVMERLSTWDPTLRFPAMWAAANDELPDMDHGGVGQMALQVMLLQCEGRTMRLFPAWPRNWDVEFKLHAPFKTVVEGIYRGGKIEKLKVTPPARTKDLVTLAPR